MMSLRTACRALEAKLKVVSEQTLVWVMEIQMQVIIAVTKWSKKKAIGHFFLSIQLVSESFSYLKHPSLGNYNLRMVLRKNQKASCSNGTMPLAKKR